MTKGGGKTLSRRDLLRAFRPVATRDPAVQVTSADEPPRAGFSLDAFYAGRAAAPALPPFAVKPAAAPIPTTRVGIGRTTEFGLRTPGTAGEAIDAPDDAQPHAVASAMVPQVLPKRCLATTSFCSVCLERCPIEGAIVVTLGQPRVDASRCDGCGRCIAACPAPILAFELVPREPSP